ncbi:MAG: hypothetical protein M5U15_13555 [Kiritimatiellae bacterium]|nr:hypothetical protein [Kiritimatiellia bacterium]
MSYSTAVYRRRIVAARPENTHAAQACESFAADGVFRANPLGGGSA